MTRRPAPFVIGLVAGSHVVNHAYLLLFAPAFALLREEFGVSLAAVGLALGVVNVVVTAGQLPLGYVSDAYSHTAVLVGSLAFGTLGCLLAAVAPTYEWLLAAALVPIRVGWSRRLIDLGTGLVFAGVLLSGVLRDASTVTLVVAGAATILAWDAAENATSLGGQIGAHSATPSARAELVHIGITAGVALVAVAIVLGVGRLGVDGLPFAALLGLLIAGVLFALVANQ